MRFDRDITVSIDIDAPLGEVWARLETIESHIDWMADASAIRFHGDQRRGVGTSFVCDTKVGPVRLSDEMEITVWEPEAEMGVVHRGLVTGRGSFRLEPIDLDRRCRLIWSETLSFPWWMGGPIGAFVGGFVLERIWRRNLATFRRLVGDR
ncbi:MAG: SRPBCC family protein [Ilumatobacter sp.]|nr:SRPBCC family protein [Ilumatobacter sp.]